MHLKKVQCPKIICNSEKGKLVFIKNLIIKELFIHPSSDRKHKFKLMPLNEMKLFASESNIVYSFLMLLSVVYSGRFISGIAPSFGLETVSILSHGSLFHDHHKCQYFMCQYILRLFSNFMLPRFFLEKQKTE